MHVYKYVCYYVCLFMYICVCMYIIYIFVRIISYTSSDQPSKNNKIENINIYKSIKVEKVKERISKLQSTMKGFEYDEVINPLSISFKNMYMALKSNGNRVDYKSGVVLSACFNDDDAAAAYYGDDFITDRS